MKNRGFTNEVRPLLRVVRGEFPRAEGVPDFGGEDEMHLNLEPEIGHDSASRAHSGLLLNLNSHPGRDQNRPSLGSIPAARWAANWFCSTVNAGRMEGSGNS
jgi:hypothetical protein